MIGTLHIVVAMKPLSGNFVQNAKKHGVAGLNIDGVRIAGAKGAGVWGTSNKTINPDRKFNASPEMGEYRSEQNSAGRFPSNVILGHLAGCRCVGTKRVRASTADADGKETVEAWECASGCPVAAFPDGGASGRASGPSNGTLGTHGRFSSAKGDMGESKFYGDVGSAARFFKQVREQ